MRIAGRSVMPFAYPAFAFLWRGMMSLVPVRPRGCFTACLHLSGSTSRFGASKTVSLREALHAEHNHVDISSLLTSRVEFTSDIPAHLNPIIHSLPGQAC